jgi:hypothetical protein
MIAQNKDQSRYPSLWDGLRGWWAAPLGKTGRTLRNWSAWGRLPEGALQGSNLESDWSTGLAGAVLNMNGVDGYVSATPGYNQQGPMTIAAWLRPDSLAFRHGIMVFGGSNSMPWMGWYVNADGTLRVYVPDVFRTSAGVLPPGQWTCVTVTLNTTLDGQIFLNGRYDSPCNRTTTGSLAADRFWFGRSVQASDWLVGGLGPVGLWSRVLSPSEILALARDPRGPLRLRCPPGQVTAMTNRIYGPYQVAAGGAWAAGAAQGDAFTGGAVAGQVL